MMSRREAPGTTLTRAVRMTQDLANPENNDNREGGLSWPRIAGISFALALHAAALLLLLAPISPPAQDADEEDVVNVTFIEPPPPPPPPPTDKPPPPIKTLAPPTKAPVLPPPEDPPVVLDTPRAVDVQAPPPSPPAPPAAVSDMSSGVDPSSRAMNPPKYPPEEQRRGIQGTTVLVVSIDASGGVLDVEVEKSSGNRNLDRAAVQAARRWRFNPEVRNGQKVASRVRVPVEFKM